MCMVTFNWEENDSVEKAKNFTSKGGISWAVLEITESCNLNCVWCYANSNSAIMKARKHMSLKDLERLLKRLSDAGVRQVTYSGGEPTVYPHIKEAVKMARDMGLIVHMNTNGFAFTKELAADLKQAGLSQIQTNIESINPAKHDCIRGMRGSFERSVKALINAQEASITPVSQTVLTSLNENEIESIFSLSLGLGVKRCRTWDMTPSEGMAKSNSVIGPKNYTGTLENLYNFAVQRGVRSIESGEPLFPLWRNISVPVIGGFCIAYHGAYTTIAVNGDAMYCAAYRKPMYNVFDEETALDEMHRHKLQEFIAANVKMPENCRDCRSKICMGGCIVRREANKGVDRACEFASQGHLEMPILKSL